MGVPALDASSVIEPIRQLAAHGADGALAIITRIDGPSYRPLGAMMAVMADGARFGTLSSGCVESDIALHAVEALREGRPKRVIYGKGSPYSDIQLPCGGGLEISLVPRPSAEALKAVLKAHDAREAISLNINAEGLARARPHGPTGWEGSAFNVAIEPEIMFYVFGKGPEAASFAGLVQAAGYPNLVLSPDDETLEAAQSVGCETRHMTGPRFPDDLAPDQRSAIVLFFHDHEWEPPILEGALASEAFYIGAQGSQRAAALRKLELESLGVGPAALARLHGPIGLVPSVRDARKLAISVLAQVVSAG